MVKCYFKTLLTNLNYYQMKKSLLGFLALAGVLVGCQNYDDQFDALNQQILELQTELDGLTDIETDLAALVSDLSDLSDTVQDIEDNALTGNDLNNALAGVLSTLEQLRDRLSDLEQDVADIDVESQVASATADIDSEVADLNEEIERIEAALRDLLEASAVIDQDLNIRNQAELAYAKTLFPSDVTINAIVRGSVTIEIGSALTDSIAAVDALTDRIATVVRKTGAITFDIDNDASSVLSFDALTFIDGSAILDGKVDINNVATIADNLTLTMTGTLMYPNLTSVDDIRITSGAGVTEVNFANITGVAGDVYTGASAGQIEFPDATSGVNLGTLAIPGTVDVGGPFTTTFDGAVTGNISATTIAAGSVDFSGTATATGAVAFQSIAGAASDTVIDTDGAITISGAVVANVATLSGSALNITGNVSLTAASTFTSSNTTIGGNALGAALTADSTEGTFVLTGNASSSLTVTAHTRAEVGGNVNAAATITSSATTIGGDINAATTVTGNGGSLAFDGEEVNANLTATVDTFTSPNVDTIDAAATLTLNDATAITLPELATNAGQIVAGDATSFTAVQLVDANTIDLAADATVSVGSVSDTANHSDWATYNGLTVAAQDKDLDISAAVRVATFNVTGKANSDLTAQDNDITVTAANVSLTSLVVGGASVLSSIDIDGTGFTQLTTAGRIKDLIVSNNASLTTFNFGHAHIQPGPASTVEIDTNASLQTLDLSSLTKVATITISGNASLTSITAPTVSSNPNEMATTLAPISVQITGNDLAATYTDATAATGTTSYVAATFSTSAISGFKSFIQYYLDQTRTTVPVVFNIEFDFGTGDSPASDTAALNGDDGVSGNADDQLHTANANIDGDYVNKEELLLLGANN